MPTSYMGLACTFHDPAVAVVDAAGQVVFAQATERHLQVKRAFHCPPDGLPYISNVLRNHCEPGTDLVVAKSWSKRALRGVLVVRALQRLAGPLVRARTTWAPANAIFRSVLAALGSAISLSSETVRQQFERDPRVGSLRPNIAVRGYDHHLTHAAAACFTSPFEEAVCAVVDGYGEWSSTAFFHYREGRLRPLRPRHKSLNSLGFFYLFLCAACGFDPVLGEEWKVMGLAPYGKIDDWAYRQLRQALRVEGLRIVGARRLYGNPVWRARLRLAPEDLAFTGQKVFEECMAGLLGNLHGLGLSENLVLAGGCALNSSCNGKILSTTGFRRLHVFSAPADDGNALGAALLAYREDHPEWRPPPQIQSPYLGDAMSSETLERVLRWGAPGSARHLPGGVHRAAARALAEGKIIGWVQGRAEFGPRALGNRSILADPRRPEVKDRINRGIKFREAFRPFAPAVLHEHGPDFFESYEESPYMERTLRFRKEAAGRVPGVVHVDGTGRLQTVRKEWNERFHALLQAFYEITGVPVLLNTSFNVMGRPIVHSVEDAVAAFVTTALDALVIGDHFLEKP